MFSVYLIIGAFAGLMAGFFGIGGGLVIIPALAMIFSHYTGMPSEYIMQMSVGTSLATILVTGTSALYAHHQRTAVIWSQVRRMIPWLVLGAIIGAVIVQFISSNFLRILFSIFLVVMAMMMLFKKPPTETSQILSDKAVKVGSTFIGAFSSILGIGGGAMLVPFLLRCNLDMYQATGTSVACGLAIGMVATICFMITGLVSGIHLSWSTGYIYWPAFLGISAASVLFAPFGAGLAHRFPKDILKKIFGIFLLIMSIDMMFFS